MQAVVENTNPNQLTVVGMALYFCGTNFYKWLTSLPKYSSSELARYNKLVDLHHRILGEELPIHWKLEEGRPTYVHDFVTVESDIRRDIEKLSIPNAAICLGARGILNSITQLLGSLSHRTRGKVPGYSIEIFFFTELARVIITILPTLSFDQPDGIDKLKKILNFCEGAMGEVIPPEPVSWPTEQRVTPGYTLDVVIGNLSGIIQSAEAMNESLTFMDHIKRLDASLAFIWAAFYLKNCVTQDIPIGDIGHLL